MKKNYVYKVSDSIFKVMETDLEAKQEIAYSNITTNKANSFSYDYSNSTLFFIDSDLSLYYIQSGDTEASLVSGFVLPISQPGNAAYHQGAIWYFEFNSNVLVKITLLYTGGVPSISSKTTYTISGMNLPSTGTTGVNTNTFGDIAIDNDNGILYACTSRGRIYSVNLSDPVNTFNEILSSPGNDKSIGLQLAYDNNNNVLYGHNHTSGEWYSINTSNGSRTSLNITTSLFRDIGGSATTQLYGSDVNGDIYLVNFTISTPDILNQFYLPKRTDTTPVNTFDITIETVKPDQGFRIGIFNSTSEPSVQVDWDENSTTTYITSDYYQQYTYEDIGEATIKIAGNFAGGELRIGEKSKPYLYNGSWSTDYANLDVINSVTQINGISNLSSIKLTNSRFLTSVQEDFFVNVTGTITNLNNTFENTGLNTIPSGLLSNMSNVTSYVGTFKNCFNVSSVPIPMFYVHSGITSMANFLDYTIINNYDNFLDWLYTQANSINLTNITLGACGNTTSNSTGATARSNLINNLNWSIIDGSCDGLPPPTPTPTITITPTPTPTPTSTPTSTPSSTPT